MTIHVFFVNMQVVKIEQKHSEYLENISEWFVNSEQNISFYLFLLLLFFFRSKQIANIAPKRNIIYKGMLQQLRVTCLSCLIDDTICGKQVALILLLFN